MKTKKTSSTTLRSGATNQAAAKSAGGVGSSRFVVKHTSASQKANEETILPSNSSFVSYARLPWILYELRDENPIPYIKKLDKSKNDNHKKNEKSSDTNDDSSDEEGNVDAGNNLTKKKMNIISSNVTATDNKNKNGNESSEKEEEIDKKETERGSGEQQSSGTSAHKIKFNKALKTTVDSDDEDTDDAPVADADADDEHTDDDDDDTDNRKEGDAGSLDDCKNNATDSGDEFHEKLSGLVDLREKMSNLKLKEGSTCINVLRQPFARLQLSTSSEESSDESDGASEKYGLIARGPVFPGSRTPAFKQSSAPYQIVNVESRRNSSRFPECALASVSVPQRVKEPMEDLNNITLPDSEAKFLKAITPDELQKLSQEFSVNFGLPNRTSFVNEAPQNVLSNNSKPDMNSEASLHLNYNIPVNNSDFHDSGSNATLNYSSKPDNFNLTERNQAFEIYDQNHQTDLCSTDSGLYQDMNSAVTYGGLSDQKKTADDEQTNTSDYGSPSATSELSPAPSLSPEYPKDGDSNLFLTLSNPGAYVGTYNYSNSLMQMNGYKMMCDTKMNISGDQGSAITDLKSTQDIRTDFVPNITSEHQPELQQNFVKPIYSRNVSLPNTKQVWTGSPSAGYNPSSLQNIDRYSNVTFSPRAGNGGKMVLSNSLGQSLSGKNVLMSGGSINGMFNGSSKEIDGNSINKSNYRRIVQERGPQVYESGMQKPGYERLMDMCKCSKKKSSLLIQWVTALVETNRLDDNNKPLIIINLLNQLACVFGDKPMTEEALNLKRVWTEKLLAYTQVVYKLLLNPDVFSNPDSEGNTPLKIAAFDNYREPLIARVIADCIVKNNKNPDEVDQDGNSILHRLCQKGESHVNVLAELLNVKKADRVVFDVNCTNYFNETPLHVAVNPKFRSLAVVKVLISHNARVDVMDHYSSTPLHIALSGDYDLGILKVLLESQSCQQAFNIIDNEGNTPLKIAVQNRVAKRKQLDAIQLLIISGANIKQLKSLLSSIDPSRREDIKNLLQKKKK